jgi:hypothetical protein
VITSRYRYQSCLKSGLGLGLMTVLDLISCVPSN